MYLKTIVQQAGESIRVIKKVNNGITQAVLYLDHSNPVVITRQGKTEFYNLNQANTFMRRI